MVILLQVSCQDYRNRVRLNVTMRRAFETGSPVEFRKDSDGTFFRDESRCYDAGTQNKGNSRTQRIQV